MEIVLATGNQHKVIEIQALLPEHFRVVSLKDIGFEGEIPEDFDNLEDNSLQKALHIFKYCGKNCLAEDTGLFVPGIGNEPGVYSARYAGPQRSDADNMALLLSKLGDSLDRNAYFKTVMTLVWEGTAYQFDGILEGNIALSPSGEGGFGYDPIFEHEAGITLAQIGKTEKGVISHRGKALRKVLSFLGGIGN